MDCKAEVPSSNNNVIGILWVYHSYAANTELHFTHTGKSLQEERKKRKNHINNYKVHLNRTLIKHFFLHTQKAFSI